MCSSKNSRIRDHSLHDFFTKLPFLTNSEFDEVTCYNVWKVLTSSILSPKHDILEDTIDMVKSSRLNVESANNMLRHMKDDWRKHFIQLNYMPNPTTKLKKLHHNHHNYQDNNTPFQCTKLSYINEPLYYCMTCFKDPVYTVCEDCFDPELHIGHKYSTTVCHDPSKPAICCCGNTYIYFNPADYKPKQNVDHIKDQTQDIDPDNEHIVFERFSEILDYLIDTLINLSSHNEHNIYLIQDLLSEDTFSRCNNSDEPCYTTFIDDSFGSTSKCSKEKARDIHKFPWKLKIYYDDNENILYSDISNIISEVLKKETWFGGMKIQELLDKKSSTTIQESDDLNDLLILESKFNKLNIKTVIQSRLEDFLEKLMFTIIDWLYTFIEENEKYAFIPNLTLLKILRRSILNIWESNVVLTDQKFVKFTPFIKKINLLGNFSVSNSLLKQFPSFKSWNFKDIDDSEIATIMNHYNERINDADSHSPGQPCLHGSRFQYMLTFSGSILPNLTYQKLLKCISNTFCINDSNRIALSAQYFDIYFNLIYSATLENKSPSSYDTFISIFSQFTMRDPTNKKLTIPNNFIERSLFLSYQLIICPPYSLRNTHFLENSFKPLKKIYIQKNKAVSIFPDLDSLLSLGTFGYEFIQENKIDTIIFDYLKIFNKILPLKRETLNHVEYENNDYSSTYYFYYLVLMVSKAYTRGIIGIIDPDLRLELTQKLLSKVAILQYSTLAHNKKYHILKDYNSLQEVLTEIKFTNENIFDSPINIVDFKVGVNVQSFFHPFSTLYGFIQQYYPLGRYSPLSFSVKKDNTQMLFPHNDPTQAALLLESPLTMMVLISQIDAGFWLRNGESIVKQKNIISSVYLREYCHFNNLRMIQLMASTMAPNDFLSILVVKWGLKNWAGGIPMGDYPDQNTTLLMVHSLVLLLIRMLSYTDTIKAKSSLTNFKNLIKTEITHNMGFKTYSFKSLSKNFPPHLSHHQCFHLWLQDLAVPVRTASSSCKYKLKDEHKKNLDPYYIGLTSSKSYELEKDIRNEMASEKKVDYVATFVPVNDISTVIKDTEFKNLFKITSTELFGIFLKNTLDHIVKYEYENLLSIVTHLIHVCLVNNLTNFAKIFFHEYGVIGPESQHYHSIGSILYKCLLNKAFMDSHGKIIEIFRYISVMAPHVNISEYLTEQTPSYQEFPLTLNHYSALPNSNEELEIKRKFAAERKKKLMRKFAKQQNRFLKQNKNENINNEGLHISNELVESNHAWNYPEESCVFCKIPADEDKHFVFFSFKEKGIIGHEVDTYSLHNTKTDNYNYETSDERKRFQDTGRMRNIIMKPIVRSCGHGAHLKCLDSHMKQIRDIHAYSTKNISPSYGFGLFFCPLCQSLSNSFLPIRSLTFNNTYDMYNSEDLHELIGIGFPHQFYYRCALVLINVGANKVNENMTTSEIYNELNELFVNSVSNLDLFLRDIDDKNRDEGKLYLNKLPSQNLLVLRILSELKFFFLYLQGESIYNSSNISLNFDKSNINDENMLKLASKSLEYFVQNEKCKDKQPKFNIEKVFLKKICQIFLKLTKKLSNKIADGDFETVRSFCQNERNKLSISDFDLFKLFTHDIFVKYVKLFFNGDISSIEVLSDAIFDIFIGELKIFYRRIGIMLYSMYYIEEKDLSKMFSFSNNEELSFLANYLHLPSLEIMLNKNKDLLEKDMLHIVEDLIKNPEESKQLDSFLSTIDVESVKAFELTSLPYKYSQLFRDEEERLHDITDLNEIGICLFCNKRVKVHRLKVELEFKIGECYNHLINECPGNNVYGIFLLTRNNMIYLTYGSRGIFYDSPYRTIYGEVDEGIPTHSSLYLDKDEYNKLINEILLGNLIPHFVFRYTGLTKDIGGWETI